MRRISVNGRLLVFAILLVGFSLIKLGPARAAAPQGISVSPAYQQVTIPQGASSKPLDFTVSNHESQPVIISITTQDFNTLGETGGLVFVGSNPTQLQKKYGLAKWISLPQKQLALQPGQTKTINAQILNLPSLSPGGHYGALMLSLGSPAAAVNVTLHPIASSLLFVTKIGGDTHKLALAGVTAKHNIFKLPGSVTLRFHNTGNSHVVPRGIVSIFDSGGRLVSKGIINQSSDIVLPESFRLIDVPLQHISNSAKPGKYKLVVDFRLDGLSQYRRYESSFWMVPWYYLVGLAGLIVIVFLAVRVYRNLRSWNSN